MSSRFRRKEFGAIAAKVIAAAGSLLLAAQAISAPTARLSASRTSGPAPLAVFFDATGSTDTNSSVEPFRQNGYRFTFGDAASGTWTYSGLSRNEQIGAPLAAHVFETPGTYTVQVTAVDAAGASSTAAVTITVTSADSVYAGTSTVCISRTSDFAGCPAGAQQIANAGSWPAFSSNRRYLLHRGQDFNSLGQLSLQDNGNGIVDAQLGAFGSGARPQVARVYVHSGAVPDVSWHKRVVVMDLSIGQFAQYIGGSDLLVLRNNTGYIGLTDAFAWLAERTAGLFPNPQNIFVVDNSVDVDPAAMTYGLTGNGVRMAVLGNSFDRSYYHSMRLWQTSKTIISHNNFRTRLGNSAYHALKVHSAGTDPVATVALASLAGNHQRTSQVTISNNLIGSSETNVIWTAESSPQNDAGQEGVEFVIWEDNEFRFGPNHQLDVNMTGRQITERGNTNATTGGAISVNSSRPGAMPSDWIGPYFIGQPSMRSRFGASIVRPKAPEGLQIN